MMFMFMVFPLRRYHFRRTVLILVVIGSYGAART